MTGAMNARPSPIHDYAGPQQSQRPQIPAARRLPRDFDGETEILSSPLSSVRTQRRDDAFRLSSRVDQRCAIVAGSSSVIDVSKRWATVRTAAERLLTTPAMSRFSTDTVSDAV